jgi:hypothetical protein
MENMERNVLPILPVAIKGTRESENAALGKKKSRKMILQVFK